MNSLDIVHNFLHLSVHNLLHVLFITCYMSGRRGLTSETTEQWVGQAEAPCPRRAEAPGADGEPPVHGNGRGEVRNEKGRGRRSERGRERKEEDEGDPIEDEKGKRERVARYMTARPRRGLSSSQDKHVTYIRKSSFTFPYIVLYFILCIKKSTLVFTFWC